VFTKLSKVELGNERVRGLMLTCPFMHMLKPELASYLSFDPVIKLVINFSVFFLIGNKETHYREHLH
jgi:hypothetical protein